MSVLLALSAFQSWTQTQALEAIRPHLDDGLIDGIQLTPGNVPSEGFHQQVTQLVREGAIVRLHHGFGWHHYRLPVWNATGEPLVDLRSRSVHPPRSEQRRHGRETIVPFSTWITKAVSRHVLSETMYPGYCLGNGQELNIAMDARLPLAVDIAHLDIQHQHGVLDASTLRRLCDYGHIDEVHVSHSLHQRDTHSHLNSATPLLGWALERGRDIPLVLESYWHRTSADEQRKQLRLLASARTRRRRRLASFLGSQATL